MKRRSFLALPLVSVTHPVRAAVPKLVGILSWHRERGSWEPKARKHFQDMMAARGFADGSRARYEWRYSEHQVGRVEPQAAELVGLRPDAILAFGSIVTGPVAAATSSIPIVCGCLDAVREGYSGALGRPTRNVTGYSEGVGERASKLLDVLKSLMPSLDRVGVLVPAGNPVVHRGLAPLVMESARKAGLGVVERRVDDPAQVAEALSRLRREGFAAVIALNVLDDGRELARLGLENRLAVIEGAFPAGFAKAGGLMAYHAPLDDFLERVARQLEKILRGVPVRDIPFEGPAFFRLEINRRTAAALGLTIPRDILLRADEVHD